MVIIQGEKDERVDVVLGEVNPLLHPGEGASELAEQAIASPTAGKVDGEKAKERIAFERKRVREHATGEGAFVPEPESRILQGGEGLFMGEIAFIRTSRHFGREKPGG